MGENNGFDEVFVSVMGRLYRRMVAVTGSKTDAEDLVQEVYVRLSGVRQRKRFLEHPSPYAYAFVTAMNLFRTWWKRDRRTELVEHVELGVVLLALPAGALLAMQAAGRLSQRFGSRAPTVASAVLLGCVVVGPALAWSLASLWVAVFAIGLANGALDVAMNVQAVAVERQYGRSVMNAFHAVFSLGAAAGALLGGAALAAVLPTAAVLGVHGLLLAATALACAPALLNRAAEHPEPAASAAAAPHRSSRAPAAAWLLGLVGFCCLLGEGAAGD